VPLIRFGSSAGCIHVCNTDLMVANAQHAACNLCRVLSSLIGRYRSIFSCVAEAQRRPWAPHS